MSPAISIAPIGIDNLMFDFDKHLADLANQTVLCIGDLMLDEFVYGEVTRISPEAPTPVIAVKRSELMVGGAGNVARNLVSLGTHCIFVGVVGDDETGGELKKELAKIPRIERASGSRCRPPDDPQGAVCLGTSLDTYASRRLGSCFADRFKKRRRVDRARNHGHAESRRCGAVGLRQGRADAARRPRRHRRRQQSSASRWWSIRKAATTASIAARR